MAIDRNLGTVERLLGVVLIFLGFINLLLSISGNYPLDQFAAILFLFGIILFVHASGKTWHKWVIIGMAAALMAVFLIRGEVGRLAQVGLFWGTLAVIIFYIFFVKEPKPDEDTPRKRAGTED